MPDNFINQDDIDEFMLKRMKTMSLKNKPIRFCDNPEQEELGLVEAESSTTLLIRVIREGKSRPIFRNKDSIKITEIYPFEYGRIDWMLNWANDPELVIKMTREDHDANLDGMRYEYKHDHYWAEHQGLCCLYYYTGPGRGYGGRTFKLKMKDETTKALVGPWSSGYHNTNLWFPECTCCTIEVDEGYGSERPARFAGHIRTDVARTLLPPDIFLCKSGTTICPSLSPEKIVKTNVYFPRWFI